MRRRTFSCSVKKISAVSVLAVLVAIGIITHMSLSVKVIADSAGADGDGNAWGGESYRSGLFISTESAAWKAQSLSDIAAGNVSGVSMNADGSITIQGFNGTGNFHAAGATITCPAGTTHLYQYSLVAQRDGYGYKKGDLVGLMGTDGNSPVYNSNQLGGGTKYDTSVSGALSWSSVQSTYQNLYDQGLVHVGWGNGAGLSWFCSAGDGVPNNNPNPTCGGVSGDTTYMTTKLKDKRLAHKGWVNEIYAMPTDEIRWNNCYSAGVQNHYKYRSHEFSEISGSFSWRSDDPEPDYSVHNHHNHITTNIDVRNINQYFPESNWQNFFKIDRNFSPLPSSYGVGSVSTGHPWEKSGYEYHFNLGSAVSIQRVDDYYISRVGDVGTKKYDSSRTGVPTQYSMGSNYHTWCGTGGCEWEEWEQNGSVCGYDGAWRPAGYAWSYWDDWSGPGHWVYSDPYWDEYANARWCWVTHSDYNRHNRSWESTYFNAGSTGETATVYVPYNFWNSTEIQVEATNNEGLAYAGGTLNVKTASATIHTQYNGATEAEYATIVRNAKVRLVAYATPNPGYYNPTNGDDLCAAVDASVINGNRLCEATQLTNRDLNSAGNLGGATEDYPDVKGERMVYDANAGDYMCYAMAIYPANSGAWTNWQDPEGNHQWAFSNPSCLKIAKKPYFGVYGGSIYSVAQISTSSMGKTNIFGVEDFGYSSAIGGGTKRFFGSFVEQSVFGINAITGLASGSAYLQNKGVTNNNYCKNLVPLTMANAGNQACKNDSSTTAGLMGDVDKISVDKEAYVDFWLRSSLNTGEERGDDGLGKSTRFYSNTGKDIYYTYVDGSMTAGGASVLNGTTRLVKVSGDIRITGDIV